MKDNRGVLTLIILILMALSFLVRYPLMTHKTIVTHDEAISYLAAAGKQDDYANDIKNGRILGKFIEGYRWKAYLKSDSFFNFSNINKSLSSTDVHPPFYFWILHIWNQFFDVNIKNGVLLNIFLSCITTIIIFILALKLTGSIAISFLVTSGWIFSYSWDATLYVRQYETLGLLSCAFYLVVYKIVSERDFQEKWVNWLILAFITSLGLLTHIYFAAVASAGILFLFIKLLMIDGKNKGKILTKTLGLLIAILLITLLLFPQYPGLLTKLLTRSSQNFPNPARDFYFKNSLYTLFYGITGRYAFLINNFPYKGLFIFLTYLFSLIFILIAIWSIRKWKSNIDKAFIPAMLIWNVLVFSGLYLSLKLADWAIGGQYYAHIIPLVPLTIASLYPNFKQKEKYAIYALAVAFLITVSVGTIFYLKELASIKPTPPSVIFQHYPKIVCDNPARGDFFGLVMYLPDGALLYLDGQDNLIRNPQKWAPALRPGDMLVCIESYDSIKAKQPLIVNAFEKTTGKKLTYYPGYVSNVSIYVLLR